MRKLELQEGGNLMRFKHAYGYHSHIFTSLLIFLNISELNIAVYYIMIYYSCNIIMYYI